MYGAVKHVGSC